MSSCEGSAVSRERVANGRAHRGPRVTCRRGDAEPKPGAKARWCPFSPVAIARLLCTFVIMGAASFSGCKSGGAVREERTRGDRAAEVPSAESDGKPALGDVPACSSPPPVRIIFDTDIGPDCDDAAAVAMLHALADRCEIQIIGMMSATSYEYGAAALDALNTYYGRPNIPVGTLKDRDFLGYSHYSKELAEKWPNDLQTGARAPDAVVLFQQLLSQQPDKSVTIVSVGPLRNARNLIASPGGKTLVARKVKEWSVMGGFFPDIPAGEWNFKQDGRAAQEAIENWPTPIMFSGGEFGDKIITGTRLFSETEQTNPVRRAYLISADVGDRGRPSWDLTSVLYAARGLAGYFAAVGDGYNEVFTTGVNKWRGSPNRQHAYLRDKMSRKMLAWEMDELIVHSRANIYPKTPPLPKTGWKATANANPVGALAAVDGNSDTEWETGRPMAPGDFVAVDMGKVQEINRLEIDGYGPGGRYARGYELYVSDDGKRWGSTIKSGRGSAVTIIAFQNVTTRHLKIVQTGTLSREHQNADSAWRIREVDAFLEP